MVRNCRPSLGGCKILYIAGFGTTRQHFCCQLYSPKSQNLKLRGRTQDVARDLIPVWPRATKFGNRCWNLLYPAYVKGRYSLHYVIRHVDLEWLVQRIEALEVNVKVICERQLNLPGTK